MNTCQDRVRESLPEFVHGLLDPKEMVQVAEHLEICEECALEVSVLRQLENESIPEPPPWFWTSLPVKVTAQAAARRKRKLRVLVPVWAGGLAAAAVVMFMFVQPGSPPPPQNLESSDYSALDTGGSFSLGFDEEILSVAGMQPDDLDQVFGLDHGDLSEVYTATMDFHLDSDGYGMLDERTIRIFEGIVDEMIPERIRKKVMS